MRVALISDIHGNYISLDAVLADIEQTQIDDIICLGDVATLGPQPHEVISRLTELDCHFIAGNHEVDLLNIPATEQRQDLPKIIVEAIKWCSKQLSNQDLDFLRTFRPTVELQLDSERNLLAFHAAPKSNTEIILASTPSHELDKLLADSTAHILVGGHTHIQMLRRYKTQFLINPGSVGEPLEQMPVLGEPRILPWAEYAIVDVSQGKITVELYRVPIDVRAIKEVSLASNNPLKWADFWLTSDEL